MTDEQIVKALECCGKMNECKKECPLGDVGGVDKCIHTLMLDALELIKRQQAEIKRLKQEATELRLRKEMYRVTVDEVRAEAIREFAERLKAGASRIQIGGKYEYKMVTSNYIDYLVKEMTEKEGADNAE